MTKNRYLSKKTHGSVAPHRLMFKYLLASFASKDGKTNLGDSSFNRSDSRLAAYPHFLLFYPLSHEFSLNNLKINLWQM